MCSYIYGTHLGIMQDLFGQMVFEDDGVSINGPVWAHDGFLMEKVSNVGSATEWPNLNGAHICKVSLP